LDREGRPAPPPPEVPADHESAPPRLCLDRLACVGDAIVLRDARGRSRRPALERFEGARAAAGTFDPLWERAWLAVRGPFTILQRFTITAEEGRAFVESSGDSNPIHREDSIVPGAMTAARFLLLPEILLPGLAAKGVRVKFRAFSHYGLPTTNVYACRPEVDGLSIQVKSYQRGTLTAEASVTTGWSGNEKGPLPEPAVIRPADAELAVIRAFLESLKIVPERCLEMLGFDYPRAFLASLPSGEMVRMGGEGGLLNVLDLEFAGSALPSLAGDPVPVAEVRPSRPRASFRKVLATVGTGVKTYCTGYATVLVALAMGTRTPGFPVP
jgi:hypothetical protein